MSVLTSPEAVPSRIGAVFRYLLTCEGQAERLDQLVAVLSPQNLRRTSDTQIKFKPPEVMRQVIDECRKLGLTSHEGDKGDLRVCLSERSRSLYGRKDFDVDQFTKLIRVLLMDENNSANHDMCCLLAWLLAQDAYEFTGYEKGLSEQHKKELGSYINNAQFGDLRDWSVFLGLAWRFRSSVPGQAGVRLMPDPTKYMLSFLQDTFKQASAKQISLPELLGKIAIDCPVLQGGFFYKQIAASLPSIDKGNISSALSVALLRLQEREIIGLESKSDAPVMVLADRKNSIRVTHVVVNRVLRVAKK